MPAWNEAEGLPEFVRELNDSLAEWNPIFFIVDDCSTDNTEQVVRELSVKGLRVDVYPNPRNMGHGPSTITALKLGLDSGASVIVAIDGDGQFTGADVARVVERLHLSQCEVVEGVRTGRQESWYRVVVSAGTRALVWARSRRLPRDANTPLRAYRSEFLKDALQRIPAGRVHLAPEARSPGLFVYAQRWLVVPLHILHVQRGPKKGEYSRLSRLPQTSRRRN
jgi:glycosyltransferase involved in cell wall biosynthesis